DGEQQLFEQFLAYQVFFSAGEQLVLSYLTGPNRLPSDYVERARQLAPFAEGEIQKKASLYLIKNDPRAGVTPVLRDALQAAGYRLYDRGETITTFPKTALDGALVESLYGSPLRMSPSRIEKYHSCRFAFFVEYGLGVRDFRKASFSAIEAGEMIHYIFEKLGRDARDRGGFSNMEEDTVLSLTEKYAGEFYDSIFDAPEYRSKRVDYLFDRLTRDAKEIASNMYEEFVRSRFEPYLFEQSFGSDGVPPLRWSFPEGELAVYGRMDRADRCVVDDKAYIRIIDYKTGAKDFNLTDLYYGLNVQLPMYLFHLVRKGEGLPGGFFYMPSKNELPDLPRGADAVAVSEAKAKLIRYKGMANANPAVLEAMDSAYLTPETRLPFVARNGSFRSDASMADEKKFGQIEAHMEKLLRKMTDEICRGDVKAEPFMKTSATGCDYCRYRAVCKVYPGARETMINSFTNLNCKTFFEALDREERENDAQTE
ncbi:MAG: PD-(D/E)XK nuclease family protein, partial [Clostridia bacterium]|nr:PD-(D/E)XK nuclease family protein [Clostridia bacterium]